MLCAVTMLVHRTVAHSWIACADYTEKNGAEWDPNKCRGFARDSGTYAQKNNFGMDRGFDHKPGQSGSPCKTKLSTGSYSNEYPKAIYFPGQQVVLAHPMKNHGAASCTNIHIPDFGSAIYRGLEDTDTDQPYSYYTDKLVSSLGTSVFGAANTNPDNYPKPGYQNAPNFCDNTDKAMGTYSYNVPTDLAAGSYTFVWSWKFNGPSDIYSGCMDVIIAENKAARDKLLQTRDSDIDLSVPCGGETSDEGVGSTAGCDDPNSSTTPPTTSTTTKLTTTKSTTSAAPVTKSTTSAAPVTTSTASSTTSTSYSTPTVSTSTTGLATTTSYTKKTTTEGDDNDIDEDEYSFCLPVLGHQFTGSINVGVPPSAVSRRYICIDFYCDVESITVWSGRLAKRSAGRKYEIIQDSPKDLARGVIDFFVSYSNCDFSRYQPSAKLMWED